jgi:hypothetical protein
MSDDDPMLRFADGDRALANVLRSSLQRLSDGAGGDQLRWMARDALTGTTNLRELAAVSLLRHDLQAQFDQLRAWRDDVGEAEFNRQATLAGEQMTAARAALDRAALDRAALDRAALDRTALEPGN